MRVEFHKERREVGVFLDDITELRGISDEERAGMSERYGRDMSWAQTEVFLRGDRQGFLVRETAKDLVDLGIALVTLRKGHAFVAQNVKMLEAISAEEIEKLAAERGAELSTTFRTEVHFTNTAKRWSTVPKAQLGDRIDKALGRPSGAVGATAGGTGPVNKQAEGGPV